MLKQYSYRNTHLLMLLCMVLIAGSFPIAHAITDALPPVVMMWLRFLFAALLFIPLILWRGGFIIPSVATLFRYSLLSIPLVVFFWCMFEALRYTSALNTGAIYTIVPVMTAGIAFFVNGERTNKRRALWLILGMLGAVWIIFRGSPQAMLNLQLNYGDGIFLLGSLFMAANGPLIKRYYRNEPLEQLTFWLLLMGSGWLLLASLTSTSELSWQAIDQNVIWGLLYLTLFTTLITFFLFNHGTVKLGAIKASA